MSRKSGVAIVPPQPGSSSKNVDSLVSTGTRRESCNAIASILVFENLEILWQPATVSVVDAPSPCHKLPMPRHRETRLDNFLSPYLYLY